MSNLVLFEQALRDILRDVIREELAPIVAAVRRIEETARPPAATEYLSAAEAARIAGVEPETVAEWTRRGDLPRHRAGRLVRVRRDELDAFLARRLNGESIGFKAKERLRALLREASGEDQPSSVRGGARRRQ